MRTGFAILAHQRLDRAAALAAHLAAQGAPVVLHIDRRVPRRDHPAPPGVQVISTRAPDWGGIAIVEATLDCVRALLPEEIDHVCLLSGSCLPIRPVAELAGLLADHPDADFIESVPATEGAWVQDGLSTERFTLFHPFSYRRHRRLFDASVAVQRGLGLRRRLPDGLDPHLGMQWWCLSTRTLRALIDDPRLPAWLRFFRRSWIPDEGFFQSVVRTVRPGDTPHPPLHLARFDPRGRPYTFHDDHAGLLADSGLWFARKIDPDAGRLYACFLDGASLPGPPPEPDAFGRARDREQSEGLGILSAARYPVNTTQNAVGTVAPYLVLVSDDAGWLASVSQRLAPDPSLAVHDRLFSVAPAFANGTTLIWGNLAACPGLRDHRPAQFLSLTVRATIRQGLRPVFAFAPLAAMPAERPDRPDLRLTLAGQFAGDPNARLILGGDAAALLARLRLPPPARRGGRPRPPLPLRAWWLAADPSADPADLRPIATGDWSDPAGWTLPADPPPGWPT